jgi:hypothetical protein
VFIRRVRTAPGATAVQIAQYAGGRQRIARHVGPAHRGAGLGILLARARQLPRPAGQDASGLGVEPAPQVTSLLAAPSAKPELLAAADKAGDAAPARAGVARVVCADARLLSGALAGGYCTLGFDAAGDEGWRP